MSFERPALLASFQILGSLESLEGGQEAVS
jgi:hypothetical protein